LSQSTQLLDLDCASNQLISLNVMNGNNNNMALNGSFNASNNVNLALITLDSCFTPPNSGYKSWLKDETANWNSAGIPIKKDRKRKKYNYMIHKNVL